MDFYSELLKSSFESPSEACGLRERKWRNGFPITKMRIKTTVIDIPVHTTMYTTEKCTFMSGLGDGKKQNSNVRSMLISSKRKHDVLG